MGKEGVKWKRYFKNTGMIIYAADILLARTSEKIFIYKMFKYIFSYLS